MFAFSVCCNSIYQISQTGIPHNLPYSGAEQFVGRGEKLELLHQNLSDCQQVVINAISGACAAIAAIAGIGGIGKTELIGSRSIVWGIVDQANSQSSPMGKFHHALTALPACLFAAY